MDTGIVDRAQSFCKYKGITSADFERISGLANGMIKKLSEKTRRTTYDRISNAFPDLDIDWLRLGEGEMIKRSVTMIQNGDGGVHQQGQAGTILNQTANSEKMVLEFFDSMKAQTALTEKSMAQTDKVLEEISEQRKMMERLISMLEKK